MVQFGKRLRALRKKRGLSQGDIERATGLLPAYTSRVEHGRTTPSLENIHRFAAALGVPVHELFREGKQGAAIGAKEDSFLRLIAAYLRKVDAADRDLVLAVANRLAKKDP
jgi:transcriptional regulator with XRE-family HTH domain